LRVKNWLREETKDKDKWPFFTMSKVTSGIPQQSVLRSVLLVFMTRLWIRRWQNVQEILFYPGDLVLRKD